MIPLAVSTVVSVLAIIGLVVGLVVLAVVIWLLNDVLSPLRSILGDLKSAKTAPMLERGVPGTDQLGQTRRLADSVPPLALAYLQKLSLSPAPAPPPPAAATFAPPAFTPPAPAPAQGASGTGLPNQLDDPRLPAWKRYRG